ncbi:MurR/RpiR family transcriptional regulator [Microbacterium esteraromaticum]|uniref:MurR/RpiR family transcriptional regulator n=1 Tax=Microbacterium esteraromaticum TaxID=57043 RepID=UPI001C94CD75|nr:MurR/RpiR family transcriptional regulator [Microbacterium esteraromaticum]MBY6060762.1 MurR/RpiR family transcriptional regulator [Microbacterium esteraromaticum]
MPRTNGDGNDRGMTIARRIAAGRRAMPAAMSKIADVVTEHPTAPVELTITELAERAGTSPATVTRFCRALGFDGYTQFRVGVASEIGRGGADQSWQADIGQEFGAHDEIGKVLQTLLTLHVQNLETTAAHLDLDAVLRVADAIAASDHVDIYGVGGSGVIAREFQARLYRIGVRAHSWSDVHEGLTSAVMQNHESVAIGISSTGRTEETVQMLSQARSAGAFTVAITHDAESWLAGLADVALSTAAPTPYLRPDDLSVKHSQLLVLDLLYLLVAQQTFGVATTHLAASAMAVSGHRRAARSPKTPALQEETR